MKNNKKLKGFTLIELIIVLAIFGIILSVVMSILDPTSKIMRKATTRERTAAYADNISEYITNSVTYAKYIRVYNGDFCKATDESVPLTGSVVDQEKQAAKDLIDEMLNDAVDKDGNPVKGQVHILKLINSTVNDAAGTLTEGKIYESVYNFKAGAYVMENIPDPANPGSFIPDRKDLEAIEIYDNASNNPIINRDVINPEHFEDYNYFYKKGFYTLDPIEEPAKYSKGSNSQFSPVPVEYYSSLNEIRKISNITHSLNISVISYAKDKDNPSAGRIKDVDYQVNPTTTEKVTLFRSPAHLNAASMALINAKKVDEGKSVMFMKPARDTNGDKLVEKTFIAAKAPHDYGQAYVEYEPTFSTASGNIYIVYIMPNEMSDVGIKYHGNSNAPSVTPQGTTTSTGPENEY